MKPRLGHGDAILLAILVLFIISEYPEYVNYHVGDENAHFYMARIVAEGGLPYRDFFFSHPPVEVLVLGLVYKVFGFYYSVFKLVPVLQVVLTGGLLYLFFRKENPTAGLFACAIFLFSQDVYRVASFSHGINMTVLFIVAGIILVKEEHPLAAGIVFALASSIRLYALPAAGFYGMLYLRDRGLLLRFAAGFVGVLLIVNLVFIGFFGSDYVDSVYLYHLSKKSWGDARLAMLQSSVISNLLLFLPAVYVLKDYRNKQVREMLALVGVYTVFIFSLNMVFYYYFMLLFPLLAVLSSQGLLALSKEYFKKDYLATAAVIVMIFSFHNILETRTLEPVYFNTAPKIASYLKENTAPGDTLFGEVTAIPLIALLSGRDLSQHLADTNSMRFASRTTPAQRIVEGFMKEPPAYVVTRKGFPLLYIPEFREYVNDYCMLDRIFSDEHSGEFLVYKCG